MTFRSFSPSNSAVQIKPCCQGQYRTDDASGARGSKWKRTKGGKHEVHNIRLMTHPVAGVANGNAQRRQARGAQATKRERHVCSESHMKNC